MRFIFMKRGFEATGFLLSLNFLLLTGMVRAEQSPTDSAGVFKSEFYEENERCFSCHGDKKKR
jgi:hypothetical protein